MAMFRCNFRLPLSPRSVTPPRHVMAELAAEVQGRLRM